ncbi:hypothetical protein CCH79_00013845, partial [Gambusia affinis]
RPVYSPSPHMLHSLSLFSPATRSQPSVSSVINLPVTAHARFLLAGSFSLIPFSSRYVLIVFMLFVISWIPVAFILAHCVQNVSQSMEVVHLRTSRDLQYVRDSEPLLRGVDGHLHTYVASPRALTSKTLQELKGQMSQLRPLLSVVEQYRLDLQMLTTLRMELLNLSIILTAIQEEVGAYDYEELQQRVLLLETRLHSCMNKLGCGRLTAVSNPITVKSSGSRFGSWMTDAMIPSTDSR